MKRLISEFRKLSVLGKTVVVFVVLSIIALIIGLVISAFQPKPPEEREFTTDKTSGLQISNIGTGGGDAPKPFIIGINYYKNGMDAYIERNAENILRTYYLETNKDIEKVSFDQNVKISSIDATQKVYNSRIVLDDKIEKRLRVVAGAYGLDEMILYDPDDSNEQDILPYCSRLHNNATIYVGFGGVFNPNWRLDSMTFNGLRSKIDAKIDMMNAAGEQDEKITCVRAVREGSDFQNSTFNFDMQFIKSDKTSSMHKTTFTVGSNSRSFTVDGE